MKIKAIIFGATGMVGEGVLHESLNHRGCGISFSHRQEIVQCETSKNERARSC